VKKGCDPEKIPELLYPDEEGVITIEMKEDERVEILLRNDRGGAFTSGYVVVGDRLRRMPIGSTLDRTNGILYWQPGPAFFGEHRFVFVEKAADSLVTKKIIKVIIIPGY